MRRKTKIFAADFETTVYTGQNRTEVWASALAELGTNAEGIVFHSLAETLSYIERIPTDVVLYYHNLKFDGSFIIDYFLRHEAFKLGAIYVDDKVVSLKEKKQLLDGEYIYSISSLGQWYTIVYKEHGKLREIRDSLKLLPFSLSAIGKAFQTKHQKLSMKYVGYRYAGCVIYPKEMEYILNDVYVLREALEIMFDLGHNRLTIGSCCLREFKQTLQSSRIMGERYRDIMPDLYAMTLEPSFGYETADSYVRASYRGGWCYLVRGKENKVFYSGVTADVNSLYPSVMHSESGNRYPIGKPVFWSGNFLPEEADRPDRYYYIRVRCSFVVKSQRLPCLQIKRNPHYPGKENLMTSDIWGTQEHNRPTMVWSRTDYELYQEQYNLTEFEILDGCWFYTQIGLFDAYIDKYRQIKITSKGALRTLAKLFLVNLNGKMGSSDDSSFKVAYLDADSSVKFNFVEAHNKEPGYIPIGAAITAYARAFTVRAAQMNYYGPKSRGFVYADTDSIHCDLYPEELKGIKISDTAFNCWKLESCWSHAIFIRQKCYLEYVTHENLSECLPYYNIKGSGLKTRPKDLLATSFLGQPVGFLRDANGDLNTKELSDAERKFLLTTKGDIIKRDIKEFCRGLVVPGNLKVRRIEGGVVLEEHEFKIN